MPPSTPPSTPPYLSPRRRRFLRRLSAAGRLSAAVTVNAMPETLLTNQDSLRRLLLVFVSACVALFGWSANRELHQIGESTRSTNAHVANLDTALRGLLVESASTSRRLDYVEEMTRENAERLERGCPE